MSDDARTAIKRRHFFFGLDKDAPAGKPSYIEVQGAARMPGEWFPCEHPERDFDADIALHDCCPRCLIAVEAANQRGVKCWGGDGYLVAKEMRRRIEEWGPAPILAQRDDGRERA